MVDFIMEGFDLADYYKNPVILGDGVIGQMMEPVELLKSERKLAPKDWATTGTGGKRKPNIINTST